MKKMIFVPVFSKFAEFVGKLCNFGVGIALPTCGVFIRISWMFPDELLSLLDGTLRAARASRLNAALTIQLCSHVLHAINATLFNALVGVSSQVILNCRH